MLILQAYLFISYLWCFYRSRNIGCRRVALSKNVYQDDRTNQATNADKPNKQTNNDDDEERIVSVNLQVT